MNAGPFQRGGGGGRGAQPLNMDDRTGFESIFDGTMKNWDGDPAYWKAQDGMLVGETTAENANNLDGVDRMDSVVLSLIDD